MSQIETNSQKKIKKSKTSVKNDNKNKENTDEKDKKKKIKKKIRIALAGNPNVGKSVIFNQLTGLSQVVGNWPGKTVAKAEGQCFFKDYIFQIIDLPGIYSLSTYSLEEVVSREYIIEGKPDYIINVVDTNHFERNLFLTLQLLMLERPVILALNQYDLLQLRGYEIDIPKLESMLGVIAVPTVAVHNRGIHELLEAIIDIEEGRKEVHQKEIRFGKEVETKIEKIISEINKYFNCSYPQRFLAAKLLEKDEYCIDDIKPKVQTKKYKEKDNEILIKENFLEEIEEYCEDLENIHGEQISTVINAELYKIATEIDEEVIKLKKPTRKLRWENFIDHVTLHSVWGYAVFVLIMLGTYWLIFSFGNAVAMLFDIIFQAGTPWALNALGGSESLLYKIVWNGIVGGFLAGVGGVLPYVIPFYFFIEVMQDTGYLSRAAYLMDRIMHGIGVHGKTIIPLLLGFGCNVPAVTAGRIMETEEEKRRAILYSTMVPCSATTTIILGLVGRYMGLGYALLVYLILFIIIAILGKILIKRSDEHESELIIELHQFRKPNFKIISLQTWQRSREFIYMALPLIVILGIVMQLMLEFNLLSPVNVLLKPFTVYLLGLPIGVGIYLIYGILRKELNLVLLSLYVASLGLTMTEYMTPIQMFTFAVVTMLYIPCLATIITVKKEVGTKFAWQVTIFEISLALIVGGIINWGYRLVIWLLNM